MNPIFVKRKLYCIEFILVILMTGVFTVHSYAQDELTVSQVEEFHQSPFALKMWNNPIFQQQFTQSYIAETEIEPRVTIDEREQMQKVLDYISSDNSSKAIQLLDKEISKNEGASAVYDFTLANLYFQQADAEGIAEQDQESYLQMAADAYQAAVTKWPKFRRAWRNLALIHIRKNQYKDAISALVQVIELGGNDAITYGLLGFAYSSEENSISAESAYRMAILLDPVTLDWKMGLAQSFFRQGQFSQVAALSKQLIKEYPDQSNLWLLQANAYIGLEQPLKAAEIYEFLNHLGKSTPDTLNTSGDIYINEELYEMAVNSYILAMNKDLEGKPDRAIRAAKVLAARAALDETQRLVEQVERLYSDKLTEGQRKDLLKLRARIAVANGSGDEEVRVLKEIVALDPLDGEALILLGQHSDRNGKPEMAIHYFEQAAGIEKYEADAKVQIAQLLVREGKYDQALPLLRRAQQIKHRENIQKYLEQVERIAKTR